MLKQIPLSKIYALIIISTALLVSGCIKPSDKIKRARLLKTESASKADLIKQIDYFANVNSMRAFMDLKFEDNSYADEGIAEKYKTADGEVVVQRPGKILLKVKVPVIKTDVAQMTSDGSKFRVAILQDGGSGKYKKFVMGTNDADYSQLQEKVVTEGGGSKDVKKNVNAFSNLRPQHFTDAMLVRPTDVSKYTYLQSTIVQEEIDLKLIKKKSPVGWVLRGYYLLEEFRNNQDGSKSITRRFWFDRVGKVRLARQQIFDQKAEIESDIVYGVEGNLTETGEFKLPLEIAVTRPKEKYKMRLIYKSPKAVKIGKTYKDKAFVLENRWNLEVIDLDNKLKGANSLQKTLKNDASKSSFVKDN